MHIHLCLNVKSTTVKPLDKNMGVILRNFGLDNSFLDMVPNAQEFKIKK